MSQTLQTALAVAALLTGATAHVRAEPVTQRPLAAEDYFRFQYVGDPRISPEGDEIAYTVSSYHPQTREYSSRIWTVPIAGGAPKPMTSREHSSTSPRYSPDGKYLAFTSARDDGETQIWLLPRRGGEAIAATDVAGGVGATVYFEGNASDAGELAWSPDSTRIVFVRKDPEPETDEDSKSPSSEAADEPVSEVAEPWVVTRRQFKLDYEGYLDERRAHLWVVDIASGQVEQITYGDYDDLHPAWSPTDDRIAFVSNRSQDPDADYNTDIWIVDLDADSVESAPRQVSHGPGSDGNPVWSPDGTRLAYLSVVDAQWFFYATKHLAVVELDTGATSILTESLDRNVSDLQFSPDGRSLHFVLEDSAEQNLARVPISGGAVERRITGADTVLAYHIGGNGTVAARISRPERPSEIHVLQGNEKRQITDTNADLAAELQTAEIEEIAFDSSDGIRIEALVVKPHGFDRSRRYPTILYLHGGPQAQHDFSFGFNAQLWAANGYLVVMPNPRGSTGYGQQFCLDLWQDWGGPDYDDVIAAVDAVIERGWADPDRLAVTGWSYGGILTNYVITRTDRFKAAVTGAGATLYVVNYGHDQYQRWWEAEFGLPWDPESRRLWERMSPFNRVDQVVTPTLIVGGEHDWNVPIINSEQLFLALKRLGVETEMVIYPGEHHSIREPTYILDLAQRRLDWFARYLGDASATADGS